jgi:hypothetical protein
MLVLFLVHLLSVRALLVAVIEESSLPSSCIDYNNCRSLLSTIWSCITIIFLCTWMAVHPNVPQSVDMTAKGFWSKHAHQLSRFRDRIVMFICALLVPEYILAWATLFLARRYASVPDLWNFILFSLPPGRLGWLGWPTQFGSGRSYICYFSEKPVQFLSVWLSVIKLGILFILSVVMSAREHKTQITSNKSGSRIWSADLTELTLLYSASIQVSQIDIGKITGTCSYMCSVRLTYILN